MPLHTETDTAAQLTSLIAKLQAERQEHADAIAEIDATFERFGISHSAPKRRGRPRKVATSKVSSQVGLAKHPKKRTRRGRRKFAVSGSDSVLTFVKNAGKKGTTTSEIVKHWKSEGRAGDGYTLLGQLVKAKQLKKEKIEGAKGSRYTVA